MAMAGADRQFWHWHVVITIEEVFTCPGIPTGKGERTFRHCKRDGRMHQNVAMHYMTAIMMMMYMMLHDDNGDGEWHSACCMVLMVMKMLMATEAGNKG